MLVCGSLPGACLLCDGLAKMHSLRRGGLMVMHQGMDGARCGHGHREVPWARLS